MDIDTDANYITCRICEMDISSNILSDHSSKCLKINQLQMELNAINEKLIKTADKAIEMKRNIIKKAVLAKRKTTLETAIIEDETNSHNIEDSAKTITMHTTITTNTNTTAVGIPQLSTKRRNLKFGYVSLPERIEDVQLNKEKYSNRKEKFKSDMFARSKDRIDEKIDQFHLLLLKNTIKYLERLYDNEEIDWDISVKGDIESMITRVEDGELAKFLSGFLLALENKIKIKMKISCLQEEIAQSSKIGNKIKYFRSLSDKNNSKPLTAFIRNKDHHKSDYQYSSNHYHHCDDEDEKPIDDNNNINNESLNEITEESFEKLNKSDKSTKNMYNKLANEAEIYNFGSKILERKDMDKSIILNTYSNNNSSSLSTTMSSGSINSSMNIATTILMGKDKKKDSWFHSKKFETDTHDHIHTNNGIIFEREDDKLEHSNILSVNSDTNTDIEAENQVDWPKVVMHTASLNLPMRMDSSFNVEPNNYKSLHTLTSENNMLPSKADLLPKKRRFASLTIIKGEDLPTKFIDFSKDMTCSMPNYPNKPNWLSRKPNLKIDIGLAPSKSFYVLYESPSNKGYFSDTSKGRSFDFNMPWDKIGGGDVNIDDFEFIKMIGRGGYGRVWLVKKKKTGDLYAMKIIELTEMMDNNRIANLKAERDAFKVLEGNFVVKAVFTFIYEQYLCFVMEYMVGGDFGKILEEFGCLSEEVARQYFAELVLAVDSLHSLDIVHRDLKPDNFLLDKYGCIKLADFGLSEIGFKKKALFADLKRSGSLSPRFESYKRKKTIKFFNDLCLYSENNIKNTVEVVIMDESNSPQRKLTSVYKEKKEHHIVGTPDYIAPEILRGEDSKSFAIDWWSMGVILYEFVVGIPPFNDDTVEKIFDNIQNLRIEWPPLGTEEGCISHDLADLIKRFLDPNPRTRMGSKGIEEIKNHPFFAGKDLLSPFFF